jgi:hypothetical protein
MNKIDLTKKLANMVVGLGTVRIARDIIRRTAMPRGFLDNVSIAIASTVIASMASDATKNHVGKKIDEAVEWWQKQQEDAR